MKNSSISLSVIIGLSLLMATSTVRGQAYTPFNHYRSGDTTIFPLEIGNRWYYSARRVENYHDRGLFGMVLEVTGFTSDSFAIVQVQKRWTNQVTTSVEYWQQYNGDFFMESTASRGIPVYTSLARDSTVHSVIGNSLDRHTVTWTPESLWVFGSNLPGQSFTDDHYIWNTYGGMTLHYVFDVARGLGLHRRVSWYTGGVFAPWEEHAEMRGALLNGILYGDTTLLPTGVSIVSGPPSEYVLFQNYPNPFNSSTIVTFQIPKTSFVTIRVFDLLGNEVATLVNGEIPAGKYETAFDESGLSSGMYLYTMQAGLFSKTNRLLLLK